MSLSSWGLVAALALSPALCWGEDTRLAPSDPDACLKDDLCRAQYSLARELSKTGNLKDALTAYEAAYQRQAVPILLFNIARLHHRLGNFEPAVANYRRYLQTNAASEAAQRSRAQEYLLEALQGLEDAKQTRTTDTKQPTTDSPPTTSSPGTSTSPAIADAQKSAPSALVNPSVSGSPVVPSPEGSPRPDQSATSPSSKDEKPKSGTGWLTYRRKLSLGFGLGITGAIGVVALGTGVSALRLNSAVQNALYVGTGPTPDVQSMQSNAHVLATVTDVAIAASAVSLAVTLVFTLRRPSAPSTIAIANRDERRY